MFSLKKNSFTQIKHLEFQFKSLLMRKFFNENEIFMFGIDHCKFYSKDLKFKQSTCSNSLRLEVTFVCHLRLDRCSLPKQIVRTCHELVSLRYSLIKYISGSRNLQQHSPCLAFLSLSLNLRRLQGSENSRDAPRAIFYFCGLPINRHLRNRVNSAQSCV